MLKRMFHGTGTAVLQHKRQQAVFFCGWNAPEQRTHATKHSQRHDVLSIADHDGVEGGEPALLGRLPLLLRPSFRWHPGPVRSPQPMYGEGDEDIVPFLRRNI